MWKQLTITSLVVVLLALPTLAIDTNTAGPLPFYLDEFLRNGSGASSATADYSGALSNFSLVAPWGVQLRITEFTVTVEDGNINNEDQFGGISALPRGLDIYYTTNGTKHTLDGNLNISSNGGFRWTFHDITIEDLTSGSDYLEATHEYEKSGTVIRLDGNTSDAIVVAVNDDFTGLTNMRFFAQGYNETTYTLGEGIPDPERDQMSLIAIAILIIGVLFFVSKAAVNVPDRYWQLKMGMFYGSIAIGWTAANIALRIAIDTARSPSLQSNLETFYLAYNTVGIMAVLFMGIILFTFGFERFRDIALFVTGKKVKSAEEDDTW